MALLTLANFLRGLSTSWADKCTVSLFFDDLVVLSFNDLDGRGRDVLVWLFVKSH